MQLKFVALCCLLLNSIGLVSVHAIPINTDALSEQHGSDVESNVMSVLGNATNFLDLNTIKSQSYNMEKVSQVHLCDDAVDHVLANADVNQLTKMHVKMCGYAYDQSISVEMYQIFVSLANALPAVKDLEVFDRHHWSLGRFIYEQLRITVDDTTIARLQVLMDTGKFNIDRGCDDDEHTMMHYAARDGATHVLDLLMNEHHAKIHVQDIYGRTPLMFAVMFNRNEAGQFLIENGADLNTANGWGVNKMRKQMILAAFVFH